MHQSYRRLEQLYEVSKLLTRMDSIEDTWGNIITVVTQTLPLRSSILILKIDDRTQTFVWLAAGESPVNLQVAQSAAHASYAALTSAAAAAALDFTSAPSRTYELPSPTAAARPPVFIMLPLVVGHRPLFGALQIESGARLDERALMFVNAIVNQLAIAIDRHLAWTRERLAREEAEAATIAKDQFLAVVSHELRSPLTPILTWSYLLSRGGLDAATQEKAFQTIQRSARLQAKLIEDLLDLSRIVANKLVLDIQPVDLKRVIENAQPIVEPAATAAGIVLTTDLAAECQVAGDANRLQQIIWNLVGNAVKFTPRGGRVEIRLQRSSEVAEIIVRDTGCGIKPEFLPHVFQPFRQGETGNARRSQGLGLGLSIVHRLVELHHGTVHAESPGEGQGAVITVRLPLLRKSAGLRSEQHRSAAARGAHDLGGSQVLLVDDDALALDAIAIMLRDAHGVVRTATSTREALRAFDERPPDILISELAMPGEDGYALIRRVRALPPEAGGRCLAIALTAYAGEQEQQKALAAGFHWHLAKPPEPAALVRTIVTLTHRP